MEIELGEDEKWIPRNHPSNSNPRKVDICAIYITISYPSPLGSSIILRWSSFDYEFLSIQFPRILCTQKGHYGSKEPMETAMAVHSEPSCLFTVPICEGLLFFAIFYYHFSLTKSAQRIWWLHKLEDLEGADTSRNLMCHPEEVGPGCLMDPLWIIMMFNVKIVNY